MHRIKDRLYDEISKATLGREFLWVSQIARTTLGAGYGGHAAGVVMAFNIEALGKDDAAVIEVTRLFTTTRIAAVTSSRRGQPAHPGP